MCCFLEFWIQSNIEYSMRIITTDTAFANTHVAHACVHLRNKKPLVSDSAYCSSCMGAKVYLSAASRECNFCECPAPTWSRALCLHYIYAFLFQVFFFTIVGIVQMWISTNSRWCKRWNSTILSTDKGREGYASQSTLKDWLPRS